MQSSRGDHARPGIGGSGAQRVCAGCGRGELPVHQRRRDRRRIPPQARDRIPRGRPRTAGTRGLPLSLCRAVAWSGPTPNNEAQAEGKIDDGEAAGAVIKSEEEVGGTQEEIESWHKLYEAQTEGFHAAGMTLAKEFHGDLFSPPADNAPSSFAYEAVQRRRRGLAAIWESDSQHTYMTIGTTQGAGKGKRKFKGNSARKALESIAAVAVVGFGV